MPKTYFLPEKSRGKLQKKWGKLISGTPEDVAIKYSKFIKNKKYSRVITVGDFCSTNIKSDVKVFDRKVGRQEFVHSHAFSQTIKNPAGTIQKECWHIIKEAIKNKTNICIDGEEDLLVIPAVLQGGNNNLVIYGLPNKGICLIETTPKNKKSIRDFVWTHLVCGEKI